MVNSFDLSTTGAGLYGWPILPHGEGAFYNVFGRSIRGGPIGPGGAVLETFGEPVVYDCSIVAVGINWSTLGLAGTINNVYVANYNTAVTQLIARIPNPRVATLRDSGCAVYNLAANGQSILCSSTTPCEQIGIYVEDPSGGPGGRSPPAIAILGTIYLKL